MTDDKYKCSCCGGEFEKGWTDEEAEEEMTNKFGYIEEEDRDIICDDCYKKFYGGDA